MINVGLVGFGYWGPNLARNFNATPGATLYGICELNPERAKVASSMYPQAQMFSSVDEMCACKDIHAVLIATPVNGHHPIAMKALGAGKDVFVEKPMTRTVEEAEELLALAEKNGRIIAVDHTFLFTGAVEKIKQLMTSGELGDMLYFDSVRVNLGLFQEDVNVIYDLAPHDLSILCHLHDQDPVSVQAMGACHAVNNMENLAYVHLEYPGGVTAHMHLNWMSPVKIRQTIIGCTKKMVVYNDLEMTEKVKVFDSGVTVKEPDEVRKIRVDYRTGDMLAPKLEHREALAMEAAHFVDCIRERKKPLADGKEGLRVVKVLDACTKSLKQGCVRIPL